MPDRPDAKPPPLRVLALRRPAADEPDQSASVAQLAAAVLGFAEPKPASADDPAQPAARVSSLSAMASPQRGRKALSFARRPEDGRAADAPANVETLPVRPAKPRTE
jgi:hypothetical protein